MKNFKGYEQVAGGKYSSDTFSKLGLKPVEGFTEGGHHPLIVTAINSCDGWVKLDSKGEYVYRDYYFCSSCDYSKGIGVTLYCRLRSKEHDVIK